MARFQNLQKIVIGRTRRDASLLLSSGLFDLKFYAAQLKAHETASVTHFLKHGWKRGLSPSPYFDSNFYLRRYPDVKRACSNPIMHYLRHGWREGRDPHPDFDVAAYVASHADVDFNSVNPLVHRLEHISTSPAEQDRSLHSIEYQARVQSLFDQEYYLSTYTDVRETGVDPFLHYCEHGWRECRNPSAAFDTWYFLKIYPQFATGDKTPLHHFVDAGMPAHWKLRSPDSITLDPTIQNAEADTNDLSLAIHIHAFYPEFIEEAYRMLVRVSYPFDLFVTTCTSADDQFIHNFLTRRRPKFPFKVILVQNRGRDIGPMLVAFPHIWTQYDVIAHLHSKKSPHTDCGAVWRQYAMEQMFGSENLVHSIMGFLKDSEDVGFLYPENFSPIKNHVKWGDNAKLIGCLLQRADLSVLELPKVAEFAAGSMAWFRTAAFRSFVSTFSIDDFELEEGQIDVTLAHALERAFPLVAKANGFRSVCYYLKRRALLPRFYPSYGEVPAPTVDGQAWRWRRDDPKISNQPRAALQPLSQVFDRRKLDIHWIIPDFGLGAGGHMTIFRFVQILESLGHRQTIWIQMPGPSHETAAQAKLRIQKGYCPIKGNVYVNFLPDDTRQMAGDVVIATDCWTVYPALSVSNFKERFYFIQDFEPYFYPVGENYLIAEQTYRMGLCGLCAGDWLLGKMQQFAMWVVKWDLAVDHEVFFADGFDEVEYTGDQEIRIAFYSRASTPRRARRLGIAAFEELQRRGVRFCVVMFGDGPFGGTFSFKHEDRGVVSPQQLSKLYRESHIGVVFSTTNYSLVPLEMMASDLPVVEIDTDSTRTAFGHGEVSLAAPDPRKIADAIEVLLRDSKLRDTQKVEGRRFVAALSWEKSVRTVEKAILTRLNERGFQTIVPEAICTPAVSHKPSTSIFIPTFNAGPQLKVVLERLTEQDAPFNYEILAIDSGSSDGTTELIRSFKSKNVRLMEIPKQEFQHGRTRNLGIASTEGDYIAVITQDATPCDRHWLAQLIGGFALSPRVAGVIGRHKAYASHGPFVARDLYEMFGRFADFGPLYSLDRGLPSMIYPGGMDWQSTLQFYSDNNSAMARAVWKVLPYPEIDWGEDQVWSWEMLRAGFHKVYVDQACVFHSHHYTPQQRYNVAVQEGMLFARYFGWKLHPDPKLQIESLDMRDTQFALANKLPWWQLNEQKLLNKATVEGRACGAALAPFR